MALCFVCHNTITGKFDFKFSVGGDLTPKLKWIAETRAIAEGNAGRVFPPVKVLRYRE